MTKDKLVEYTRFRDCAFEIGCDRVEIPSKPCLDSANSSQLLYSMKFYRILVALPSVVTIFLGLFPRVSQAQIVPNYSLPVNSIVAPNGNIFTIDGGTAAGSNLFHSFQDFSLPTGGEVFLNGGQRVAEKGSIELGSVGSGQVSLSPTTFGWALGFPEGGQ
jgi:large exoprotein involved in heme utilization and adhesion